MTRIEREVIATLQAVKLAALGGDTSGYVCEKVFKERTGVDTKDKLYEFRKNHPDLVKAKKSNRAQLPGTSSKPTAFIYDLDGYFKLFS